MSDARAKCSTCRWWGYEGSKECFMAGRKPCTVHTNLTEFDSSEGFYTSPSFGCVLHEPEQGEPS